MANPANPNHPQPYGALELEQIYTLNKLAKGDLHRMENEIAAFPHLYPDTRHELPTTKNEIDDLQGRIYDMKPQIKIWHVPIMRRSPPRKTSKWTPRERFLLTAAMLSSRMSLFGLRLTVEYYYQAGGREIRRNLPTNRTIRHQLQLGREERSAWAMGRVEEHYLENLSDDEDGERFWDGPV